MTHIRFLGTGGGRVVTMLQTRSTGGILIEDKLRVLIDPGPGSLIQLKNMRIHPMKIDVLLLSHCHPDHYTDAEILIEAMSRRKREKGLILASKSLIEGAENYNPPLSKYHLSKIEDVEVMYPGEAFTWRGTDFTATPTVHGDPTGIGFKMDTKHGIISYTSDTTLNDQVVKAHEGARALILSCTRPLGARIPNHLSTEDAAVFITEVKPDIALLTHLGLKFLKSNPKYQAEWIEEKTGVRTISAEDLMDVNMREYIDVNRRVTRKT